MKNSPRLEQKAFMWLFLFLIFLGVLVLYPFLMTLVVSVVLAVLFYPFHRHYLKWTKGRAGLSSFLSVATIILLFLVPAAVATTLVTAQVANLIQNFPKEFSGQGVSGVLLHWKEFLTPVITKLEKFFGTEIDLVGMIRHGIQYLAQYLAQYSPDVIMQTANIFLHLFIMLLVVFYLFRDGEKLYNKVLLISPVKDQYEHALAKEIQHTIYGVFYGSFLTAVVQALLATLGYYIARVPGFLVWGALTFFVSFIPIIGTAGILVPIVAYLIIKGSYGYAIFLAIYGGVVIGSSDNLLKPLLIRSNIHQALLFLSLFGGLTVFGPMGVLIGPIIMAMLTAILRIYEKDFLNSGETS